MKREESENFLFETPFYYFPFKKIRANYIRGDPEKEEEAVEKPHPSSSA